MCVCVGSGVYENLVTDTHNAHTGSVGAQGSYQSKPQPLLVWCNPDHPACIILTCSLCLAEKKCETHDRVSEEIPYFFTKFLTIPLIFVLFYGVSSNSKLTGIYSIPELRWQFKKA